MSDAAERTIPATPRRREAAERAGMLPAATLPAWGATIAVAILLFPAWWRATVAAAAADLGGVLAGAGRTGSGTAAAWPSLALVLPTLALILAAGGAGVATRLVVDGFRWQPSRILPDLQRLGPIAGVRRILSLRSLRAAVAGFWWLTVLVGVAVWSSGRLVGTLDVAGGIAALCPLLAAVVAVAAARWGLARVAAERRIRMTPEELREELRTLEPATPVRQGRHPPSRGPASAQRDQAVAGAS